MTRHPFNEYLKGQPRPQRDTLRAIAATLADLLPGAEPCISYGMPAFKADGVAVAGFAGFAHHCSYFPHSGSVIPALGARLAAFDCDCVQGYVFARPVAADEAVVVAEEAVELQEEKEVEEVMGMWQL